MCGKQRRKMRRNSIGKIRVDQNNPCKYSQGRKVFIFSATPIQRLACAGARRAMPLQ